MTTPGPMTLADSLEQLLARSEWASGLSSGELALVRENTSLSRFGAGERVCGAGELVLHWIGVAEGILKLTSDAADGRTTSFAGIPAGAWFGEGAVLKGERRPYAVEAICESVVAFIPGDVFLNLLDSSASFRRWVMDQLNARLGHFLAAVEALRLNDPRARVAHCISEFFNPMLYPNTKARLEISQAEIASLAGLSRQITNKVIASLETDGLVRVRYGALEILSVEGLVRAAHRGMERQSVLQSAPVDELSLREKS